MAAVGVLGLLLLANLAASAQDFRIEKEAALGKQLAAEFRKHTTQLNDPTVQQYLNDLSQRISDRMSGLTFPFTVEAVIDDSCPATHAPVTLPGGYVFVPAALFLIVHDEAQFTGIMATAMDRAQHPESANNIVYAGCLKGAPGKAVVRSSEDFGSAQEEVRRLVEPARPVPSLSPAKP